MEKDYKIKEMEDVRYFLLCLLEHVYDDMCLCAITPPRPPLHPLQL